MSTLPENEFDLEKLFLPAWAQEPSTAKSYENYQGEDRPSDRREERRGGPRGPRREGGPGPRREGGGFGQRREGGFGPRRDQPRPGGENRGPRREGGPGRGPERGGGDRPFGRRGDRRDQPRERREPPPPLPEIAVSFLPDEKGVESLARQIRMAGRAYPLFDIAQMILQKPERHAVAFAVNKDAEGKPVQRMFACALDETLWLSEEEAVSHVLQKHFATFYQAEKTSTEPPKGKYTFVAQCGISGVVLGPPNHHDYQNQLRKLHADRFSRMPFEVYKSRVRIVKDEEVVKKWVEEQSWKTEYTCLNVPEALRLGTMDDVQKHFSQVHQANIIKEVETHTLSGSAARNLRSPQLVRLVRSVWEDQRRFPLQIATVLSQQFAGHGLQFFKVNRTVTHVSVARPHYLDLEATPVSEGVKKIVEFINAEPKCTRRQLIEALAPTPPSAPAPQVIPVTQETAAPTEPAQAAAPESAPAPKPAPAEPAPPSPEQTAVVADLHWLVHQGHVIEFANGVLETAKKPLPKPPKPAPVAAVPPAAAEAGVAPAAAAVPAATPAPAVADAPAAAEPPPAAAEALTTPSDIQVSEALPAPIAEPPPAQPEAAPEAPLPADPEKPGEPKP